MVLVYNSRTVQDMDDEIKAQIEAAGVPLSVYTDCYTDLGPANKSAIKRFAVICDKIFKNNLPLPPAPFIELVVDRTTGKSKLDFTGQVDGKKGTGKSTSDGYEAARYAIEAADRHGQDPKDFFTLENCALLEDTEGIMRIMEEAEKYQAIMLDDASVALDSRDFATQKSKNFNKIMAICRPMRWFVTQNAPITSHIDLRQRELMDFVAHVYKSYHEGGFNILKINSIESTYRMGKKRVFEKRFSFFGRKIDFYCAYSPDIFDPFKGFMEKYDKQREEATIRLIKEVSGQERARSNPVTKQEQKRRDLLELHGWTLKRMKDEGASVRQITGETGLSGHMQQILYARLKK
jgi:hypothetical protein